MTDPEVSSVSGLGVWSKFQGSEIPGSTRVPVDEFLANLGPLEGKKILDVGSGSGRSTSAFVALGAHQLLLICHFQD